MLNGSEVDGREPIGDFSKLLRIISTVQFDSSKLETHCYQDPSPASD